MTLPVNMNSDDYKYAKTLNEDVKITSNEYGEWDLDFKNNDYVNVTGIESLKNACVIAIMTRYNELSNPLYEDYGCHVHEAIKDNQTTNTVYKIESSITEVLENMRRVHIVNSVDVLPYSNNEYTVKFSITSINDELIEGSLIL